MLTQGLLYRTQFVLSKTEVLSKTCRSLRAIQMKDRFMPLADDVYVRRPMVIRIDRDAKTSDPENGRHLASIRLTESPGFSREEPEIRLWPEPLCLT
ncbi:hypothetical protein GCM10011586_19790 [Silvibacterium dinghuense]|nr:hypothetical protein GCM10011586_19790 [Silvibacterium dinghuense]